MLALRTQGEKSWPALLMKFRLLDPRAGIPQLEQSGAITLKEFSGIRATTHSASLR